VAVTPVRVGLVARAARVVSGLMPPSVGVGVVGVTRGRPVTVRPGLMVLPVSVPAVTPPVTAAPVWPVVTAGPAGMPGRRGPGAPVVVAVRPGLTG
jgi:hypothetical protein